MNLQDCTLSNTPEFKLTGLYNAKVLSVHDGDSCQVAISLNGEFFRFTCRVQGMDTREIKPPTNMPGRADYVKLAHKARNRLVSLLTDVDIDLEATYTGAQIIKMLSKNSKIINITVSEPDKYGRLLIAFPEIDVVSTMVSEGLALNYNGGTKGAFDLREV